MTVQQLIEKLQTLDPNAEVIIEENHGEYYHIDPERIEKEMMVESQWGHLHHASEEDEDAKIMVVIHV